jgi:hypothetical protein
MLSNIEKINDNFKLPIYYDKNKENLNLTIIKDLELNETYDISGTPIYNHIFNTKTIFGEKVLKQYPEIYTTNTNYLKDTQKLLKKYNSEENLDDYKELYKEVITLWDDIKNDTNFKDKYHYLEWKLSFCESLNTNSEFLQVLSMYNLSSPILSLLMPVFVLIIPFFIIQIKGLDLTFSQYVEILKIYAKNNAIGQLFTQYNSVTSDKKVYLLLSSLFYIFSIYQNVLSCIKYNKNMIRIHNYFNKIQTYIEHTENNVKNLLSYTKSFKTYKKFNIKAKNQLKILSELKNNISIITPYEFSIIKFYQLGIIMKYFYILYKSEEINKAMLWSFGFNGYIDTLEGLIYNIKKKNISFCKFEKKQNLFKQAYYPALMKEKHICNDIDLHKNLVITGPNASGKTTILKTALINVIFSQQLGCGFYSSGNLVPFKYIHCYLNIPDTSGRDSLFQAEARRCKDILDVIHDKENDTHFCVFDELYSGTNPEEAVNSAYSFMKYLGKYEKINCILTTHFYDLCKKLDLLELFLNCHMDTIENDNEKEQFQYTYKLKDGISKVKGGMKVLRDMNYPNEIINQL